MKFVALFCLAASAVSPTSAQREATTTEPMLYPYDPLPTTSEPMIVVDPIEMSSEPLIVVDPIYTTTEANEGEVTRATTTKYSGDGKVMDCKTCKKLVNSDGAVDIDCRKYCNIRGTTTAEAPRASAGAGDVCYRFCEDGSQEFVNVQCQEGYQCMSTTDSLGFDTCGSRARTCQKPQVTKKATTTSSPKEVQKVAQEGELCYSNCFEAPLKRVCGTGLMCKRAERTAAASCATAICVDPYSGATKSSTSTPDRCKGQCASTETCLCPELLDGCFCQDLRDIIMQ